MKEHDSRKSWIWALLGMLLLWGITLAQSPQESFEVVVNPSSFKVNESVDVTITAKKNGATNTTYTGMVWLTIKDGTKELSPNDRVLPTNGRYQFLASDLGTKTFSKGISVKHPGKFSFVVENFEGTISGMSKISVNGGASAAGTLSVDILSPAAYGKITTTPTTLIATAPELANGYVTVYLNERVSGHEIVDQDGSIMHTLNDLQTWDNTVSIVITDANDQEVGKSENLTFIYEPTQTTQLFKSLSFTPKDQIRLGDSVTFEVKTDPAVNEVSLIFSNNPQVKLPMTQKKEGEFVRDFTMFSTGDISIDLQLLVASTHQEATMTGVAKFHVNNDTLIHTVQTYAIDLQKLYMTWQVSWLPTSWFQINYGNDEHHLDRSYTLAETWLIFSGIDTTKARVFQIIPIYPPQSWAALESIQLSGVNSGTLVALLTSQPHGAPSEFFRYRPGISTGSLPALDYSGVVMIDNGVVHTGMIEKAPVCTIQGIRVTTKKEGDKYYLVRDPVQNAKLYSVYSAHTNDIRMRKKLTDTTDTKYEYPFDYQAKENVYAYFWVEAICDDGQTLDLAGATKVHVGPLQDFLLLVFISLLIYSGIKLYRYGE